MDETAKELLEAFAHCANRSKLLPDDWQRFFDYVVNVHRRGLLMTGQTVRLHLLEHGFSPEFSSRLGWIFELSCQLLTRYDRESTRVPSLLV